ncbi:MAG: LuxR C-terminal-related transcriptional regulator [Lachnospiraceae bacterium]|mgnify:FL=1|nr:LuxR C-terminal-related transcriptional regulator [Lachnospiraceae bacterium]
MLEERDGFYVFPERAKAKLRKAYTEKQPVYIYGMVGYGKTALVEQFLEKKKYIYFDAATSPLACLETLHAQSILVVDNLQFLEDMFVKERLLELIRQPDLWLIFISRSKCPGWLLSAYLKYRNFCTITETDLALSEDEIRKYLKERRIGECGPDDIRFIESYCRGHGLAIRLLCDQALIEGRSGEGQDVFDADLFERSRLVFWDYVDREVYQKWDEELIDFIMKVSIVQEFTLELATEISGSARARYYLEEAMSIGNFVTIEKDTYRLEESVVQSMERRRYLKMTQEQIYELYYNAGLYYRMHGQVMQALEMFQKCRHVGQISEILIENAKYNPSITYIYELRKYYLEMDETAVKGRVELIAGLCMIQSLRLDVEKSEYWYSVLQEKERMAEGKTKRLAKSYLAYLDIALPHRGSSNIADLIKKSAALLMNREISLPEFSITSNAPTMMNGGKDFCEWSRRDKELANTLGKIIPLVLGKAGEGLVELALAESSFEKGLDDYEVMRLIAKGQMKADAAGRLEQSYVGAGLMARLHLYNGHPEDARELLVSFRERAAAEEKQKIVWNIENMLCQIAMYTEQKTEVDAWLLQAPDENQEFYCMERYRYLTKVHIYLAMKRYDAANALLQKLLYYARIYGRTYIQMECELLDVLLQKELGLPWEDHFQKLLSWAESYGFTRVISQEAGMVYRLLKVKNWAFRDNSYKKRLFAETEKMAKQYPGYMSFQGKLEEPIEDKALQILKLQALGCSNEVIAEELHISVSTVKYHCRENYRKLGVNGKAAAIAEARKRRLI